MIFNIVGGAILLGLVYWTYKSIPPEDPAIIEARKRYGKSK